MVISNKYFLFHILVNLACAGLYAQEPARTNVSGMVTDQSYQTLEYATVILVANHDSAITHGAVTGADGTYLLKNVPVGKYRMKVSSIGYLTETKEILLEDGKRNTSLGFIQLKESTYEMSGVEVSGTRKGLNERVDKIVYYPDSIALRNAKTGVDILNKIPEVRIDKRDESISVLGNKNVLVLINGIDNQRNIVSIHPEDIERVEVITHPSVKYQSDITSVINIITKGYRQKGFSLSSNLYYCVDKKNHSGNLQLDYSTGKWHFFAGWSGNFSLTKSIDSTYRVDDYDDNIEQYGSFPISENKVDFSQNRFQYGFDYEANPKNIFSFSSRIILSDLSSRRNYGVTQAVNEQKLRESTVLSKYNTEKFEQNYSLYYLHKFKNEEEKIEINSNYYMLSNDTKHFIEDSSVLNGVPILQSRNTMGKNDQQSLNVKLDYTKPLSRQLQWENGYQFYTRNIKSLLTATDTEESVLSYSDLRNSIYTNFNFSSDLWNFQLGGRIENYNLKISGIKNSKTLFLPYVAILYRPKPNHSLKLAYRKSLDYPGYLSLNPFKYYSSDSLSYSSGNPFLVPEQKKEITFKYTYKKNQNNLSLSLNYDFLNDLIVNEASMVGNTLAYVYNNAGKANRFGAIISFSSVLFNWAEVEVLLKGSYTEFQNNTSHSGYSYSAEIGLYLPLFWDIDLEVYSVLKEREIDYNGYFEWGGYVEEILLSKEIYKNLYLGFAVWQPFFRIKDKEKQWNHSFTEIAKITSVTIHRIC